VHGPTGATGTTLGDLLARLLSRFAHMRVPCITGMLEPDQAPGSVINSLSEHYIEEHYTGENNSILGHGARWVCNV
jgi:hypothetical protein